MQIDVSSNQIITINDDSIDLKYSHRKGAQSFINLIDEVEEISEDEKEILEIKPIQPDPVQRRPKNFKRPLESEIISLVDDDRQCSFSISHPDRKSFAVDLIPSSTSKLDYDLQNMKTSGRTRPDEYILEAAMNKYPFLASEGFSVRIAHARELGFPIQDILDSINVAFCESEQDTIKFCMQRQQEKMTRQQEEQIALAQIKIATAAEIALQESLKAKGLSEKLAAAQTRMTAMETSQADESPRWVTVPRRIANTPHNSVCVYQISSSAVTHTVSRETQEFNIACAHFCRLLNSAPSRVKRVDAIEYQRNYIVRQKFDEFSLLMKEKGRPNESWVFHGTSAAAIECIIKDGFKIGGTDIPALNGSSYGKGVYTSTGPDVAMQYAQQSTMRATMATSGSGRGKAHRRAVSHAHAVILARGLCGLQIKAAGPDATCDSWVPQPNWMVFKEGHQLLPCYVVYFD